MKIVAFVRKLVLLPAFCLGLVAALSGCGGGDAALPAAMASTSSASVKSEAKASAPTWTPCASENQYCSFFGTQQVRYGAGTQWVTQTLTGGTPCNNSVFGDPDFGVYKSCAYASAPQAASTTQWILCATEGATCSFPGTTTVRYGVSTQYTSGTFTGSVSCTNSVFGDPDYGVHKSCWFASIPASGPGASGSNPPIVFNATASGRAGNVITLQGANFGGSPQVYFDGAPGTLLPIVNQVGTTWLAVQLPTSAPAALVLRVANGTGISARVLLNAARPDHLDTLQLTPGASFRVFGRNLMLAGSTPSLTINGAPATIDATHSDEYMLTATAPATLGASSAATIVVDNGNGSGPATLDRTVQTLATGSGDPFGLGVGWAAGFSAFANSFVDVASDPRLSQHTVCNGSTDDSGAINGAIALAASSGGGVVRLPAGNCRLIGRINLASNVVVQGAGMSSTQLVYDSNYAFAGQNIDLAGLRNLTLTNSGAAVEGPLLKNSTRVFLQNVSIQLNVSRQMYLSGNQNIAIENCSFVQTGGISDQGPYTLNASSGLVFQGNATQWVVGAPDFSQVHDAFIAGNHHTRDGRAQSETGVVHAMVLGFAYRVAVVGNTFDVAYGPITNKARNDGEAILTEGGGASRTENLGSVASAGPSTLTDPNNTIHVDPFGTGVIPEDYGVAIVGGTGAGQMRHVTAYAQSTLTVDRAWDVVPDSSSKYATFVFGLEKSLIRANSFSQNPRGIWLYQTAIRDVDVVGNTISEGGGIYLRAYQNLSAKYFMPIYNVLVAGNTVGNSTGLWMSYVNSVFVNSDAQDFGIANLGVEFRSNQLTANQPNVYSSVEDYAGTEGYTAIMRVENYSGYQTSVLPRVLGTIIANNTCIHCDVAVRIGTGDGGTTILNTSLINTTTAVSDTASTSSPEKSTGTVVR